MEWIDRHIRRPMIQKPKEQAGPDRSASRTPKEDQGCKTRNDHQPNQRTVDGNLDCIHCQVKSHLLLEVLYAEYLQNCLITCFIQCTDHVAKILDIDKLEHVNQGVAVAFGVETVVAILVALVDRECKSGCLLC